MTQETILEAVNGALRYLTRVATYLDQLREELLINKGLWSLSLAPLPSEAGDKTTPKDVAKKILSELDAAKTSIADAMSYARSFAENPDHYNLNASQTNFDFGIRGIGNRTVETAEQVDKLISGKLLRFLAGTLSKSSAGTLGVEVMPNVVRIGKVTVAFVDTPLKGKYLDYQKLKAGDVREPHRRDAYMKSIYTAQALLNKRDLGFLWYGRILVLPQGKIDLAPYKGSKDYAGITSIAATYSRNSDTVRVYADDLSVSTIIHELGHRYYYKFLTTAGRAHFDQWFGKVDATSKYGGTNTAEDFAEVFKAYVKGKKDLTRDQIDRFKSVLNLKARRTEMRDLRQQLRVLVA